MKKIVRIFNSTQIEIKIDIKIFLNGTRRYVHSKGNSSKQLETKFLGSKKDNRSLFLSQVFPLLKIVPVYIIRRSMWKKASSNIDTIFKSTAIQLVRRNKKIFTLINFSTMYISLKNFLARTRYRWTFQRYN